MTNESEINKSFELDLDALCLIDDSDEEFGSNEQHTDTMSEKQNKDGLGRTHEEVFIVGSNEKMYPEYIEEELLVLTEDKENLKIETFTELLWYSGPWALNNVEDAFHTIQVKDEISSEEKQFRNLMNEYYECEENGKDFSRESDRKLFLIAEQLVFCFSLEREVQQRNNIRALLHLIQVFKDQIDSGNITEKDFSSDDEYRKVKNIGVYTLRPIGIYMMTDPWKLTLQECYDFSDFTDEFERAVEFLPSMVVEWDKYCEQKDITPNTFLSETYAIKEHLKQIRMKVFDVCYEHLKQDKYFTEDGVAETFFFRTIDALRFQIYKLLMREKDPKQREEYGKANVSKKILSITRPLRLQWRKKHLEMLRKQKKRRFIELEVEKEDKNSSDSEQIQSNEKQSDLLTDKEIDKLLHGE